ncbi:MAG: hypothetical protein K2L35_03640 [Muribaculaceae bacterium]|nr:hypothetical protein [Muribaculaceae bacterium]MDE6447392.1 hypothetical protein [Muribaculaceae bacterium]MDE7343680.1 hypothetical protein [Muribaculaceae bacterium]
MKKFYAFAAAALCALAANAQALYITGAGDFTNGTWNPAGADQFETVDGNFQIKINNLTQFKISTVLPAADAEDAWVPFNEAALTCVYGEEPGKAVALEAGNDNIVCPWKGDYTITVAGDLSTITLTTDTKKPEGDTPIYVRGDMNSWTPEEAWQLTKDGNVYKLALGADQKIAAGEAFKIADADWNSINVGGDGETIMLDTETEVFNGGNPANITLEAEFTGTIYLTLDYEGAAYIYFATTDENLPEWVASSGVEFVEASDAPAQYFTLQGVRVANPENGLYIVVKNGKSYKAVIK